MLSPAHRLAETVSVDAAAQLFWELGDLSYKLDGLQKRIRETIRRTRAKSICILSSRQIGKSYCATDMGLEFCLENPGSLVRIIAPTLKQCNDIVNDNLNPICLDAPKGMVERQKAEYRWRVGKGSSLRLGALERAHVDGNRGGNADLIIYEEGGFVKGDDFKYGVDSVLGPQLLRSAGSEWFISSPSEEPDHPLHTEVLPKCELLGTSFRYTVYDSPSITPEMIAEAIRRCGGEHTEAFRREYLAEIIRSRNLVVVPDFEASRHVSPNIVLPMAAKPQLTIDWGGVRDFTVGLLHWYDFQADKLVFWDERQWPSNTSTQAIVGGLRELEARLPAPLEITARYADVPGQLLVDLIESHLFEVRTPPKDDWQAAVNNLSVLFSLDKVIVHPRCKLLVQSLKSGTFNKNRTDFDRTSVLGHMDALAAAMYAVRTQDRSNPIEWTPNLSRNQFRRPEPVSDVHEVKHFTRDLGTSTLSGKRFGAYKR